MEWRGRYGPTIRRQGKRLGGWLLVGVLLVFTVALVYFGSPFHATDGSVAAVEADDRIHVEQTPEGYLLEPANADPDVGLVFYPGGRVHPDAYVPSLAPLVREANVTVVVPRMPLNLAVVDFLGAQAGIHPAEATVAMDRHPEIEQWYVGGHSIGGAMACRYARNNPEAVDGLVLYGAYCDKDVSGTQLSVLSVVGSADTVLNWDAYERNLANLPADAVVREIEGLNHSQFGSYTGQPGDEPAPLSYGEAHRRLNDLTVSWLRNRTN